MSIRSCQNLGVIDTKDDAIDWLGATTTTISKLGLAMTFLMKLLMKAAEYWQREMKSTDTSYRNQPT